MKHKKIVQVVGFATTLLIALPLSGQTGTRDTSPQQPSSRQYGADTGTNQQNRDQNRQQQMGNRSNQQGSMNRSPVSASDLLGLDLIGMNNDKIGEVDEIYIDVESGKILGAIVSVGGVAGIGAEQYVVHLSELQYNEQEDHARINKTEQSLRNSPRYREGDLSVFESIRKEWGDRDRRDYGSSTNRDRDSSTTPTGTRSSTNTTR